MNFKIFGPFEIPLEEGDYESHIEQQDLKIFWSTRVIPRDLGEACGVYLFCVDGTEGKRKGIGDNYVWYVGKAEKQSFKQECFNGKNLNLYNQILNANYKGHGTPKMFFIVRHSKNDQISARAGSGEEYKGIQFLEKIFIQYSMQTNSNLGNKSGTLVYSNTFIEGILNDTKANARARSVQQFREIMGIKNPCMVARNSDNFNNRYKVLGPYDLPILGRGTPKRIDNAGIHDLFDTISTFPINEGAGAYVIAAQNGDKIKPIYIGNLNGNIGKATSDRGEFKKFSDLRIDERRMSQEVRSIRGHFKIYFLPRIRANGNVANPNPKNENFILEFLMLHAMMANPSVRSSDPTAQFLNGLYLEGWLNKGTGDNRRKPVRELKQILNL